MTGKPIAVALLLLAGGFLLAASPGASAHHCNGTPCETTPKETIVHVQWYIECTVDELLGGAGCDTGGPNPGP